MALINANHIKRFAWEETRIGVELLRPLTGVESARSDVVAIRRLTGSFQLFRKDDLDTMTLVRLIDNHHIPSLRSVCIRQVVGWYVPGNYVLQGLIEVVDTEVDATDRELLYCQAEGRVMIFDRQTGLGATPSAIGRICAVSKVDVDEFCSLHTNQVRVTPELPSLMSEGNVILHPDDTLFPAGMELDYFHSEVTPAWLAEFRPNCTLHRVEIKLPHANKD